MNGKPAYTRAIFRDVTERKRLERELVSERDELESVLNALDDPFFKIKPDGTILRLNNAALEYLGMKVKRKKEINIDDRLS